MSEDTSLLTLVEAHETQLVEITTAVQARDERAFATTMGSLLFGLISGVPLVGSLAAVGIKEAWNRTSYAGASRAIAEAQAEADADAARRATARAIAALLGPTLEAAQEGDREILAQLRRLEAQIKSEPLTAWLEVKRVEGVGVYVGHGATHNVNAKIDVIARDGVGIHLQGKPSR